MLVSSPVQTSKNKQIKCLSIVLYFNLQPQGPGRYAFDIGCELHGQYHSSEQVNSAMQIITMIMLPAAWAAIVCSMAVFLLIDWCVG